MEMKKVFLMKEVNGAQAETIQSVDTRQAYKLESEGAAHVLDLGHLDNYEREINKKVEKFRADVRKMKESQDPKYKVANAIDYYTAEMKAQLEQEVAELNDAYSSTVAAMKEEARRDLANQTKSIPASERQAAADLVSEAITAVKMRPNSGAIDVLLENANYYSDARKMALLNELGRLADAVEKDATASRKVKMLYGELNKVNSGAMLPIRIAEAIPSSADGALRRLRLTHESYKASPNNMHNGARR
ncbi:hypothetical protein [[Bacillus] enclensis]|uniref:hypothetical protein n=1 Tax=[Bacillus] enclensis TaxID=1402860 RepID=UPI0018DC8BD0|nr:hypothetical protein [[Bacillus] enclensis]MBH9965582.1 hypothetical protein [[Bacillus] enclensis]